MNTPFIFIAYKYRCIFYIELNTWLNDMLQRKRLVYCYEHLFNESLCECNNNLFYIYNCIINLWIALHFINHIFIRCKYMYKQSLIKWMKQFRLVFCWEMFAKQCPNFVCTLFSIKLLHNTFIHKIILYINTFCNTKTMKIHIKVVLVYCYIFFISFIVPLLQRILKSITLCII